MQADLAHVLTWQDVPGYFDFGDVYSEAVARVTNGAHFVEIGTLLGRSACFMAAAIRDSGKQITFDAIDACEHVFNEAGDRIMWLVSADRNANTSRSLWGALLAQGNQYRAARYCIQCAGFGDSINLIPLSGQESVARYADFSLDFVFIDAEHTYKDTVELLRLYLPKLKTGGVLAGHDYNRRWPGVIQAVAEVLGTVETQGDCFIYRKP